MRTKKYIVMENHKKLWRYVLMAEDMDSEKKFWSILVFQVLNLLFMLRSALYVDGIVEKIGIISPSLCWASSIFNYTVMFTNHDAIFNIVSELQEHYERHKNSPKDRTIILACYGEGNRMLRVYSYAIACCAASFITKPFTDYALQYFINGEAVIELPSPAVYPWESEGFMFFVSFALQLSLIPWVLVMEVASISASIFFYMAAVSHLQLTQERFKEIPEDCDEEEAVNLLKVALKSHREALRMIKAVESVETVKLFLQVFATATALSMCLFMLSCTDAGDLAVIVSFAVLGICVIVQLGLVCFYGQKIINEGDKLYVEIYAVPWYNYSKYFKSLIIFCLLRAGRSDRITAWSFADISMETFKGVMTTAFSYVTFLQTMSE